MRIIYKDETGRIWGSERIAQVRVFAESGDVAVSDLRAEPLPSGYRMVSDAFGFCFDVQISVEGNRLDARIERESIVERGAAISRIALLPDLLEARVGEEGYYVLPWQTGGICRFTDKATGVHRISIYNAGFVNGTMPFLGMVHGGAAVTTIITEGQFDAAICVAVEEADVCEPSASRVEFAQKHYTAFPVFEVRDFSTEAIARENLAVRYLFDHPQNPSYSHIAGRYRQYRMEECGLRTLAQREAGNPAMAYSVDAMPVRLRLAWKPVPGVEPQTVETEPPLKVAIPFARVAEIANRFKVEGIDKAEFCLVGWNCKGHDGRFPQVFPVEEELGGEQELRHLVEHVQSLGYQITAHDNWFDSYKISELWDESAVALAHDGSARMGGCWAGGQSYRMCPQEAYHKFAVKIVPEIRALGFRGAYYSDVLSLAAPFKCYHSEHPLTRRECAQWRNQILALLREQFGSASSEGLLDFSADFIERALYIEQGAAVFGAVAFIDESVPLLPIVYHGSVSYNLSWETVNCIVKERDAQLRCAEYGAVPQIYFHSAFMTNPQENWMGTADITCANNAELDEAMRAVAKQYNMFREITELNRELIEEHRVITPGLRATRYANGKTVLVNYDEEPANYEGTLVPARDFVVV